MEFPADTGPPKTHRYLWRRALVGAILIAILVPVLTWVAIDQAGKFALRNAIKNLRADGEPVEVAELVTVTREQAPDAENFCASPWLMADDFLARKTDAEGEKLWKRLYRETRQEFHQFADPLSLPPQRYEGYALSFEPDLHTIDLAKPEPEPPSKAHSDSEESGAAAALRLMNSLPEMWQDLEQRRDLPHAHYLPLLAERISPSSLFGTDSMGIDFPGPQRDIALMARVRALAALDLGDKETALRSIEIGFRLVDGFSATDLPNAHAHDAIGIFYRSCDPVIEGLSNGVFAADPAALLRIETALRRLDFRSLLTSNIRNTLISERYHFAYLAKHRSERHYLFFDEPDPWRLRLVNIAPPGWFDSQSAELSNILNASLLSALRKPDGLGAVVAAADSVSDDLSSRQGLGRHGSFPVIDSLPRYRETCEIFLLAETIRRQILIACALHRYRIDHSNEWPATLDALAPYYLSELPNDPVDGAAMRYRPTSEENPPQFLLYSIGRDRIDNKGEMKLPYDNLYEQAYRGDWTFPVDPSTNENKTRSEDSNAQETE